MQHLAQLGTVTGLDLVLLKPVVGFAVLLAVCGAQGQVTAQIHADAQHGQAGQGGIAAHLFVQIVGADTVAPVQCGKIALMHQQSLFAAGHALQGHAARKLAQLCLLHGALGGGVLTVHIFLQQRAQKPQLVAGLIVQRGGGGKLGFQRLQKGVQIGVVFNAEIKACHEKTPCGCYNVSNSDCVMRAVSPQMPWESYSQ